MPPRLARIGVREVQFDDRPVEGHECIVNRPRVVAEGAGVDDDRHGAVPHAPCTASMSAPSWCRRRDRRGQHGSGQKVVSEAPMGAAPAPSAAGIKAIPAVRMLASKLNVDLAMVTPTGADGMITPGDVQRAARVSPRQGPIELLRGIRRAMAQNMMLANSEVASATLMDDADIHAWEPGANVMLRLIRAIVAGCKAEPSLNAWYDSQRIGRWVVKKVDSASRSIPPTGCSSVLRNVGERDNGRPRRGLEDLVRDARRARCPRRNCAATRSRSRTTARSRADTPPRRRAADGGDRRRRPHTRRRRRSEWCAGRAPHPAAFAHLRSSCRLRRGGRAVYGGDDMRSRSTRSFG